MKGEHSWQRRRHGQRTKGMEEHVVYGGQRGEKRVKMQETQGS